jgi:REP element-mobilizing transposase RayT
VHPVVTLHEDAIALVGKVLGEQIAVRGYTCYACAVMPDHVHLLIRRHRDKAEAMIEAFQETTHNALIEAGHCLPTHPVWTKGGWKGFLNTQSDFVRDVKHIGNNPPKVGRPAQVWDFVTPYDGWMPGYRRG